MLASALNKDLCQKILVLDCLASPSEPCVVASLFDPVMEATSELPSSPVKTPPRASELQHTADLLSPFCTVQ